MITPSNNDTSEPRRSYHEHWFGGYNPSRPLGEDWEDQFWIEDRDDWIGYLGETNFSAKIGVIANNTAALIPDHYSGGGIISESTKLEIANDGVVIDFFQDNSSGGDGLKLLNEGGSAASQLANFQRAFLKMTSNGTEIPTAVVLNVDNSSSMGGFGQLNEGVLAFKDWIKNTLSIYMPKTSGNFQAYLDSGGNGVDIPTNENGYFMGIRINEGEDYIRQGRLAIEDLKEYEDETGKPLDGTLDDSSNGIKSLLDSTYDLDEFDMSEFQGFLEKLSTAMGTNGAETEAIKQRLKDLQNTYQSTELAHAKVGSVDIAKESTKFAKRSVLLQATASILLQANQINDVALSLLS